MDLFCATPYAKAGGKIVTVEMYAFANGWGVVAVARVAEGLLAANGDAAITEPWANEPEDNDKRTHLPRDQAQELVPILGEYPYTEDGYDEHGFAQWQNVEALREFMSRVAALPAHRLVGT